jgi:hypothetical protein
MAMRGWRSVRFGLIALAIVAALGAAVMGLWNALMPALFGLHGISYVEALGLLLLSRILFGRFGRGGYHGGPWRREMMERWAQMSPEERQRLRARWAGCGPWGRSGSGSEAGGSADAPPPG